MELTKEERAKINKFIQNRILDSVQKKEDEQLDYYPKVTPMIIKSECKDEKLILDDIYYESIASTINSHLYMLNAQLSVRENPLGVKY